MYVRARAFFFVSARAPAVRACTFVVAHMRMLFFLYEGAFDKGTP